MSSTGEQLRQAREDRGQSLAEIAESTKIGRRYLEAIERGDPDDLPGEVFVKGYIRTYAAEVGLSGDRLVELYQQERAEADAGGEDPVVQEMSRMLDGDAGFRDGRRTVGVVVALVALVLIVAGAWWFWPESKSGDPIEAPPGEHAHAAPLVRVDPSVEKREPTVTPREPTRVEPEPVPVAESVVEVAEVPDASITIPDHGVGTGVVDRQLVGGGERFEAGTTVWFWTRIVGADAGARVNHIWLHEGRVAGAVELHVGGSHWRTQSRRQLPVGATGRWVVEARDEAGRVLARDEFTVVAPS